MNIDEQVSLLMQGTEYGDDTLQATMAAELRERLLEARAEGRPLRVYAGFDPRTTDLHLGHTVPMRKLRQFQELGHEVTFVVGSYTALIGDPSDKDKLRPLLTQAEAEANGRTYAEQAFSILDREKTSVRFNAEWLSGLSFADLIGLASNFTLQQFLTRENFRMRWEKGEAVYLHETFYSLMQGYDAFRLRADVQVGGSDQLFNILTAARKIMTSLGARPNIAIILGILPGTDGVIKMSKSLGNHIPLNSGAADMFGKVMSIPDAAMGHFWRLVTRWEPARIAALEADLTAGRVHPRDAKQALALEITAAIHGEDQASQAMEEFASRFQRHETPDQMENLTIQSGEGLVDVLVRARLAASRSEARRLVGQGGVRLDGVTLDDPGANLGKAGVLQVGKRGFVRLVLSS